MESKAAKTILFATGGIIALNFVLKGKALGKINFAPGEIHSFDFSSLTLTVGIIAQNTSGQNFVVKSIAGTVTSNGYYIGRVGFFGSVQIAPNSQSQIFIQIHLAAIGILQDIVNAYTTGSTTQKIIFEGFANVDNFQVPVKNEFKIGL